MAAEASPALAGERSWRPPGAPTARLGSPGSLGPGGGPPTQEGSAASETACPATWWRGEEGAGDGAQTGSALPPGGKLGGLRGSRNGPAADHLEPLSPVETCGARLEEEGRSLLGRDPGPYVIWEEAELIYVKD